MYAIRSYYVDFGKIEFVVEIARVIGGSGLYEIDVITSYSIHYTKLYDLSTFFTMRTIQDLAM